MRITKEIYWKNNVFIFTASRPFYIFKPNQDFVVASASNEIAGEEIYES